MCHSEMEGKSRRQTKHANIYTVERTVKARMGETAAKDKFQIRRCVSSAGGGEPDTIYMGQRCSLIGKDEKQVSASKLKDS